MEILSTKKGDNYKEITLMVNEHENVIPLFFGRRKPAKKKKVYRLIGDKIFRYKAPNNYTLIHEYYHNKILPYFEIEL